MWYIRIAALFRLAWVAPRYSEAEVQQSEEAKAPQTALAGWLGVTTATAKVKHNKETAPQTALAGWLGVTTATAKGKHNKKTAPQTALAGWLG